MPERLSSLRWCVWREAGDLISHQPEATCPQCYECLATHPGHPAETVLRGSHELMAALLCQEAWDHMPALTKKADHKDGEG